MDAVKKLEQLIIILKKFTLFPVHGLDKGFRTYKISILLPICVGITVATNDELYNDSRLASRY
jgi:hypothetical protein